MARNRNQEKALREHLPEFFQKIVSDKWSGFYLEVPPVVQKKFPEVEIELPYQMKLRFIDALCSFTQESTQAKTKNFLSQINNPNSKFKEYIQASYIDPEKTINFDQIGILDISYGLTNCLYNIAVGLSKRTNTFELFKNQQVNINRWIDAFNRLTGENIENPWLDGEFANVNSWFTKIKLDAKDIIENPLYFVISGKPNNILRMSLSPVLDSCQNPYSEGTENQKLLANVFDENMAVVYICMKKPFKDNRGNIHPDTILSRRLVRKVRKGAVAHRVYPTQASTIFNTILRELGYNYTPINSANGNGDIGASYKYNVDLFDIYNLPRPYADDRLQIGLTKKWPSTVGLTKTQKEEVRLIRKFPEKIAEIENPCEQSQITAIKKHPHYLRLIKNPTETVKLYALFGNMRLIEDIKNPSELVQQYAVAQNPDCVMRFENPTLNTMKAALKKNSHLYFRMYEKLQELFSSEQLHELRKVVAEYGTESPSVFAEYNQILTEEEVYDLWKVTLRTKPSLIRLLPNQPEELVYIALENGASISKIVRPTLAMCNFAVQKNAHEFGNVPSSLQSESMLMTVARNAPELLAHSRLPVPESVAYVACENYPSAIRWIKNPSDKLILKLIRKNVDVILYVQNPSETVMLECMRIKPSLIENFPEASVRVQSEALKHDSGVIRLIKNPSVEAIAEFVSVQPDLINEIDNPSPEICWIALKSKVSVIRLIENPTLEMCSYAIEHGYLDLINAYDYFDFDCLKTINKELLMRMIELKPNLFSKFKRYFAFATDNDVQLKAVECFAENIKKIHSPSEELQWVAVKSNPNIIFDLPDPTEEMVQYVLKNDMSIIQKVLKSTASGQPITKIAEIISVLFKDQELLKEIYTGIYNSVKQTDDREINTSEQ